jgi:hypothetical protein
MRHHDQCRVARDCVKQGGMILPYADAASSSMSTYAFSPFANYPGQKRRATYFEQRLWVPHNVEQTAPVRHFSLARASHDDVESDVEVVQKFNHGWEHAVFGARC